MFIYEKGKCCTHTHSPLQQAFSMHKILYRLCSFVYRNSETVGCYLPTKNAKVVYTVLSLFLSLCVESKLVNNFCMMTLIHYTCGQQIKKPRVYIATQEGILTSQFK